MKNTKKRILTLAGIACFGLSVLCTPTTVLTVEAASPNEMVAPCADIIEWRYKIVNEKVLYRRQFNRTTNSWIGVWEFVRFLE